MCKPYHPECSWLEKLHRYFLSIFYFCVLAEIFFLQERVSTLELMFIKFIFAKNEIKLTIVNWNVNRILFKKNRDIKIGIENFLIAPSAYIISMSILKDFNLSHCIRKYLDTIVLENMISPTFTHLSSQRTLATRMAVLPSISAPNGL